MMRQLELLESWSKDLFAELSISEIMKISGKKTKPWVFNSLKMLEKKNLLIGKKKGNINLYSLNLENPLLFQTLQFLECQKSYNFSRIGVITEAVNKIPIKAYCLLVFGSYSAGKQKSSSDLDICFLVESKEIEKKIKPYFNDVKINHAVQIDEHYITFEEFVEMLLRDEESLGKQIFRNHKLFFNPDIYYKLVMEAHKNGFRA